jgi:cytochrome c-type biogenesis protein CcmH/NrfG
MAYVAREPDVAATDHFMSEFMRGMSGESHPLREFVRGVWRLLLVQLAVAVLVFVALAIAARQLNRILERTVEAQAALNRLEEDKGRLQSELDAQRNRLQAARDATPIVRTAIIAYHNRRYEQAITAYQEALRLDGDNLWVRDLLSYSQYMAGLAGRTSGDPAAAIRYFDDAVSSVSLVLEKNPGYAGGYVELAAYECARNRPDAAVAAYETALMRATDARSEFANRLGEIPQRCSGVRDRITGAASASPR